MRQLFFFCFAMLASMPLFGCDTGDESVSLTVEQRTTVAIQGLGLDGRMTLTLGDIESSDLVGRPVVIEDLRVEGRGARDYDTLLVAGDVHVGESFRFAYEAMRYELVVERIETHLLRDDRADIIIYRR